MEVISPSEERIVQRIAIASFATGEAYRAARIDLLAQLPQGRILERLATEAAWPLRLVAEALLLWIRDPGCCEKVDRLMRGDLRRGPGTPLSGAPAPWHRAEAIAALGPAVLPRVLEILCRERSWKIGPELESLCTVLWLLDDDRAIPPLLHLLGRPGEPELHAACAYTLGRLGRRSAADGLLVKLQDRAADIEVRRGSARALALLKEESAAAALRALAHDSNLDPSLRADAISSLARVGGAQEAGFLLERLRTEPEPALVRRIIEALAETGTREAFPTLEELAGHHPDPFVRRDALQATRELENR